MGGIAAHVVHAEKPGRPTRASAIVPSPLPAAASRRSELRAPSATRPSCASKPCSATSQ